MIDGRKSRTVGPGPVAYFFLVLSIYLALALMGLLIATELMMW